MPPPAVPLGEVSDAYIATLQPACSSSSSGITCTHIDLDSDADDASLDKEMEASDSMASAWTDSKHSSYLNFMEQNFVRNLYEREYCALDVCGQRSQPPPPPHHHHHHHHHVDEAHDTDSAESPYVTPFGPMEFKVWENGNWAWLDSKRKVQPWTLLSNPWVKHFRTRAFCGNDMSNTSLPKNGQVETQLSCTHDFNIPDGNPGSRGMEVGSSLFRESDYNEPESKHCIQQLFTDKDSKSRKRIAQADIEQASSTRHRAQFCLDEGSMKVGVFGEVC